MRTLREVGMSASGKFNGVKDACTTDFTNDSDVMTPEELNQKFYDEQDKFDRMEEEEVIKHFQKKEIPQNIISNNDGFLDYELNGQMTIDELLNCC